MLELDELKTLHDKAYERGQDVRDRASDDMLFYWVTQWDSSTLSDSQLSYRGEFNIIRKAGRQISADIHSNPVQVEFDPVDPDREDGAELIDGLYRGSCRHNTSKEAFDNAVDENIVCGYGGWELENVYETSKAGERNQVIKRRPIYEAVNTLYVDPNAKLLDKSDADYFSELVRYSEDGYVELVKELTGEEVKFSQADFASPNVSYVFPWVSEEGMVYVTRFHHREMTKVKSFVYEDLYGEQVVYSEEDAEENADQIELDGLILIEERDYEQYVVTRYIASGEKILQTTVVPGTQIPVVVEYGERAVVEGQELYEGVTRLAKDPQRLRNFQLSYLADIVSRSPRNKKIYGAEQIQGFQEMYEEVGSENNYPYMLQHLKDADGNPLPLGPVGETGEQSMPIALVQSIELSRQAVEDVAPPGINQELVDSDISGKAAAIMQNRIDMQSFVYQDHHKHALRRDGEIYASMAGVIYDSPRKVALTLPDGTRKQANVMEETLDEDMNRVTINNLQDQEFEVYADIGQEFSSVKSQAREEYKELINGLAPGDPDRDILMAKYMELSEGTVNEDVRDHYRKKLIMAGVKEPETPEEEAMLAEAKENQQPDAGMALAAAEQTKADADMLGEENKQQSNKIDMFRAETDRMALGQKQQEGQVKSATAASNIQKQSIANEGQVLSNQGLQLDNVLKHQKIVDNELLKRVEGMDTMALIELSGTI